MKKIYLLLFISTSLFANCQTTHEVGGENWNISNGIIQTTGSSHDTLAIKYWNYLNHKLPSKVLDKYISSLRLYTDGQYETMGGMTPLNDSNTVWEIDIDTIDFDFKNKDSFHIRNYVHTIIHEFGHILTLNPGQIEITKDEYQNNNKGYLNSAGYAMPESYLDQFVNSFWNGKLLRKWDKISKIQNERRKLRLLYKFYLKNKSQFLTDYAAESPEEDIAESWTFFVLSDKPTLDDVKHKKVLFFYRFPELVAYRNEIRSKLNSLPTDYINTYRSNPNAKQ